MCQQRLHKHLAKEAAVKRGCMDGSKGKKAQMTNFMQHLPRGLCSCTIRICGCIPANIRGLANQHANWLFSWTHSGFGGEEYAGTVDAMKH